MRDKMTKKIRRGWAAGLLAVAFGLILATLSPASLAATAPAFGPVGAEGSPDREQAWLIPSSVPNLAMHATLFRPPGDGPFPLAIINHGSDQAVSGRVTQKLPGFASLSGWLVARGYAVLQPLRPGHGATGGPYLEDEGWCGAPNFIGAGQGIAASIGAALSYMDGEPFIRRTGTVIIGNSAGGWGALAFGDSAPKGVAAIVNFSGGLGGRNDHKANNNCAPDRLIAAAGMFGKGERLPTLWLYSQNDTYFPPALSKAMADAFTAAGGRAEYHLLGPVRGDGHALINTAGSEASWVPYLAKFLAATAKGK